MNVIVTGGTSFIGLAVIRKLLESGHEVWAAVRPGSANKDKLSSHERFPAAWRRWEIFLLRRKENGWQPGKTRRFSTWHGTA